MLTLYYLLIVQGFVFFVGIILLFLYAKSDSPGNLVEKSLRKKKRRSLLPKSSAKTFTIILIVWLVATVAVVMREVL